MQSSNLIQGPSLIKMQSGRSVVEPENSPQVDLTGSDASSPLSLAAFSGPGAAGRLLRLAAPVIDRMLGIRELARRYHKHHMRGMDKHSFVQCFLDQQQIELRGAEQLRRAVPASGPAIVVCNHPYGGMEGVMLAHILGSRRADLKIMVNVGLKVVGELSDFFIFTNPLRPSDRGNVASIIQCRRHLESGGLLVLFPAGMVSFHQHELGRIADAPWNRLPARLALQTGASVTSVFISGTNRKIFHRLGRIHYRFRLLMLVREMLALRNREIEITSCRALPANLLKRLGDADEITAFLRLQTYLANPLAKIAWPASATDTNHTAAIGQPLAPPSDRAIMARELATIPGQRLLRHRGYSVYWGYQHQLPETVKEITRLREQTFRILEEGSGRPRDTDAFDASYLHLFVYHDLDNAVIGAYRLGQTDTLIEAGGTPGLYLSSMFDFGPRFANRTGPCLELGRSFIIPEYQRSAQGLYLLWQGIGAYLQRNPRYRTLYGTVSLSKLYARRSVDLIDRALVQPGADVSPRVPLSIPEHPELVDHTRGRQLSIKQLSAMIQALEPDGKDLPVLVKQYANLGAEFHCTGIDRSFADTPGLLLSIHLPSAPRRYLDRYFGSGKAAYLAYDDR